MNNNRFCLECNTKIQTRIKKGSSGLCRSCAFTGNRHPMYGRTHSKKSKSKMRNTRLNMNISLENNPSWKGGRRLNDSGYVMIYLPNHPRANKHSKYVREHRVIVEGYLGRLLKETEDVHHVDGIKTNNIINNLMVFKTKSSHINYELGKDIDLEDIIFDGRKICSG